METITTPEGKIIYKYDFAEKFFQIEPEGRIRRYQYIARMFAGGIALAFIFVFAMKLIGSSSVVMFGMNIVFILGVSFMWLILNIKRIRDIGKDFALIKNITLGLIISRLIAFGYYQMGEAGWISGYISSFRQALYELSKSLNPEINSSLLFPWHQIGMIYFEKGVGIIALVLFLYLFLVPGNKGDSQYGKDPINTKVGFLG